MAEIVADAFIRRNSGLVSNELLIWMIIQSDPSLIAGSDRTACHTVHQILHIYVKPDAFI